MTATAKYFMVAYKSYQRIIGDLKKMIILFCYRCTNRIAI